MKEIAIKKRLLMLGGRTEIYQKAKLYGFYLILIQEKSWMKPEDYELVDQVIHAPIDAPYVIDVAYAIHKHSPIHSVVSFLEAGLMNAALIQDKLGILGNPLTPVKLTKYKNKMREQMILKSVPSIPFEIIESVEDVISFGNNIGYPILLKSIKGSGSRQIHRLDDSRGVKGAIECIKAQYDGEIIAEKFIKGKEISIEAFSWNGIHEVIAITDKITTGYPNFVEIGHTIPTELSQNIVNKVKQLTIQFLDAIDQKYGPSHTECIVQDNQPYIIESHTRTGGDYIYELVESVYGFDFFDETLKRLNDPKDEKSYLLNSLSNYVAAIRYFNLPEGKVRRIRGLEEAKSIPNIIRCELLLKEGDQIKNFSHSEERYGYIFAKGLNIIEVLESINAAMKTINIDIDYAHQKS